MRKLGVKQTIDMLAKGIPGYIMRYPTVVSLEMTHSCNCNCNHCNMGGKIPGEKLINAARYSELIKELKPIIVQISGGEPLLRDDLEDIVRAVKKQAPYVIVVSNGWLLTRERYESLREAGIDQLSISLCLPDSRHDEWRGIKGLFEHLNKIIPELTALGHDDVVLNSAITHENLPHIMDLVAVAERWNSNISFSAYSTLRTGERKYTIETEEDLARLRSELDKLKEYSRSHCGRIMNEDFNIEGTYSFFEKGEMPNCTAGLRFMVVTPQGELKPCSMHDKTYDSLRQMQKEFIPTNKCGGCYVSIRSYLDRSLPTLIRDYFSTHSVKKDYAETA